MKQNDRYSPCIVCSKSLDNGSIVYCPHCRKPYHELCWKKAGYGCKIYKCKGSTLFRWPKIEILIAKLIGLNETLSVKCTNQDCVNCLKETSPFYTYCVKCGEELNSLDKQSRIFAYQGFEFIARHIMFFGTATLFLAALFFLVNYGIVKQDQIQATQTAIAFQLTEFKTLTPTNTPRPTNTTRPTSTDRPTNTPRPTATRIAFKPYTAIKKCAQARVIIGDIVVVEDEVDNLFIRSSSNNHPSSNIIDNLEPGQRAEIISGPKCSWGWMMWKIRRLDDNLKGWVAESDGSDFWLQLAK